MTRISLTKDIAKRTPESNRRRGIDRFEKASEVAVMMKESRCIFTVRNGEVCGNSVESEEEELCNVCKREIEQRKAALAAKIHGTKRLDDGPCSARIGAAESRVVRVNHRKFGGQFSDY